MMSNDQLLQAKMEVKIKILSSNGRLPTQGTQGAAGWDVYANENCELAVGEWKKINLGIALEMPPQLCALLVKRSGMAAKQGVFGQEGLIDSDYRGEVGMTLMNHGSQSYHVQKGDRIGQLLFLPRVSVYLRPVVTLQGTTRGKQGFGSTGK